MDVEPLHPGDVCLVVDDLDKLFPENVGQECVIIDEEKLHLCHAGRTMLSRLRGSMRTVRGYEAQLQDGRVMVFDRRELKRKRPPARELSKLRGFIQEVEKRVEVRVSSFSGRTAACRTADRGSIPREIAK